MSVLSIMQPRLDEQQFRPQREATPLDDLRPDGWLDAAGAARRVAVDEVPFVQEQRLSEAYYPVIQALKERGISTGFFNYTNWSRVIGVGSAQDRDAIWRDIDKARAKDPKAFKELGTREEFETKALTREGARVRDQVVASRGSATARFAGGLAGGLADPTQVGLAIATGGASRGLTIGRSVLVEGLANAGGVAVELPAIIAARDRLGEQTTASDALGEIGMAFAFGAAADLTGRVGGAVVRAGADTIRTAETANPKVVAKAFAKAVPDQLRSANEAAALHVIERDVDVRDANPFDGFAGEDAHMARASAAQRALIDPPVAGAARAVVRGREGIEAYLAAARAQESGGNPGARSTTSSASGLYGFTNGTWVATYRQAFPNTGLSDAAILRRKGDVALQERLMRTFTEANARWLQRNGMEATPGNLYVVHHLGQGGADAVLGAGADVPLARILPAEVMAANPHMKGMTAGRFREWAAERMGQRGAVDAVAAPDMRERDPAIEAAIMAEREPVEIPQLRRDLFPDEASWHVAQARVEADVLGMAEPRVTRQSIWQDARAELTAAREGEVFGALYHDEVGPIDVKWGDENTGLRKIIEKHGEVLDTLPALIEQMGVKSRSANRIVLQSLDHRAVVRLDWDGEKQNWLLSAYQVKGKAPKPTDYRRAGDDGQDGSPTLGARYNLALEGAGIKIDGIGPGTAWEYAVARGERPKPVQGVFDAQGRLKSWSTNRRDAERTAARLGDGMEVRRIAPPDLRQDVLPLPDAVAARFADPMAAEAKAQADSFTHDVRASLEAGQYRDVAFGTGETPETIETALLRLDDEDAALARLRGCL